MSDEFREKAWVLMDASVADVAAALRETDRAAEVRALEFVERVQGLSAPVRARLAELKKGTT